MERNFATVTQWLKQHAAETERQFNSPASADEIAAVEQRLGITLPLSVKSLYRLANGQPSDAVCLEGSFVLMSLNEVVDESDFLNGEFPEGTNVHASDDAIVDADPGVRPVWWSRSWVPIMRNGGGDYLCVDLYPADGGSVGQIVSYYHDEFFRSLVARGVDTMLEDLAARMESGRCRVDDGMIEDA